MNDNNGAEGSDNASGSQWHSIRPWSPRFVLTVREITSVSATFLLSSSLATNGHSDPSLASLGLTSGSDDEDDTGDAQLISESLGKGLSVNVNGAPWKRVLMRMDEQGNEAVIILYGLMPGRQYDIELGIMFNEGQEVVRSQMTTQAQDEIVHEPANQHQEPEESPVPVASTSDLSPVVSPPRTITIEERTAQLRHQLVQLAAERDTLSAQLKTARKDAQKADALLRSDIDGLRRASDKYAPAEHRARQKVLALQEAVKQTVAATAEIEEQVRALDRELPALKERERDVERDHSGVQSQARRSNDECGDALRADKKRVGDLQGELAGLVHRLDKLTSKKDKLAGDIIPDLEEQLAKLAREIELVEHGGSHEYANDAVNSESSHTQNSNATPRFGGVRQLYQSPAPIGSQRLTFQHHQPQPFTTTFGATSSNTSTWNHSPFPSGQPFQIATRPSPSTLSSRAPPFDPTARLGHRQFTTASLDNSVLSAAGTSTFPALSQKGGVFTQTAAANESQGTTTRPTTINPQPTGLNPPNSNIGGRPNSPMRQSSLPMHMPSFPQHTRQRNVLEGL